MKVETIKQHYLAKRHQLVLLDAAARLTDSCNTFLPLTRQFGQYLWDVFFIFQGMEDLILGLQQRDPGLHLPMMEFEFEGQSVSLCMELGRGEDGGFMLWLLEGDHLLGGRLRQLQQERNDSTILLERIQEQERALASYNQRLEVANERLSRFAYVLSHDLKAPLRAIGNLAQWIAEDIEAQNYSEINEHVELMRRRVGRIERLVEGLLQYSKAGYDYRSQERLHLRNLLQEVITLVFRDRPCEVSLPETFPEITTNRNALRLVFTHLINNVRDFAFQQNCRSQITWEDLGDQIKFGVIDNGPGIAPQYHERIFEIFQTVNSKDELESTGVGLTIVKKIIDDAGGKVWVESALGKGAAFYFTWPKESRQV